MDPSTFETMREEQLQVRETADVTDAAHILGKTLGVPTVGIPSFMKPQDIPGLPNQEGIPPDHDCTICAATAACGFFSEAQKNGGDNPIMRRLKAVQELTKSSPDLLTGPDAEHLIREKMAALKIQSASVIESPQPDRTVKKEPPKATELPKPDPVQVVTEKPAIKTPEPKIVKQATVTAPQPTESARPELKTTVAQFESKVQPTLSVEKPDITTTASSRAVQIAVNTTAQHEETKEPSPQTEVLSTPGTLNMVEKPIQQEAQPKNQPEQTPQRTSKTDAIQTHQTEPKEVPKPEYRPMVPKENNTSQNNTVQEDIQAVTRDTDLPDSPRPNNATPAVYSIKPRPEPAPTQTENGDKSLSSDISHQPASTKLAPLSEVTIRTQPPSEPVVMRVQETPVERPLPEQPKIVMRPSTLLEKELPNAHMESGFIIPDERTTPSSHPENVMVAPPANDIEQQVTETIPLPASEPKSDPIEETQAFTSEVFLQIEPQEEIPDDNEPVTVMETVLTNHTESTTIFVADESLALEFTMQEDTPSHPDEAQPETQDSVSSKLPESEEMIPVEESSFPPADIKEPQEQIIGAEEYTETKLRKLHGPQPVLPTEQAITLFSYEDAFDDVVNANDEGIDSFGGEYQNKDQKDEIRQIFDLPLVPLDTINAKELIQFEVIESVESRTETSDDEPDIEYPDTFIIQPEEVSKEVIEHPNETENTLKITFPEPFPLILEAEQEIIDQVFNGIEEQQYETTPVVVLVVPMHEGNQNEAETDFANEEIPTQTPQPEVMVFVWSEALFKQMTDLIEIVFEVLEDLEIEEEDLDGLFNTLFDSNPDVADEELKNDTFRKYDDTVILLWYILMIFSLFGQAMLYINPEAIKERITNPSHNIGFPPPLDSEAHISM